METRIVFMGSPEFALPTLKALATNYNVVGVVTQPDRPAGRGRGLKTPAVKELAVELGLSVIQPQRLKEPEAMEQLKRWEPQLVVVAAFGQILRPEVLDLPSSGCLNVHASLLPRWRGAAPVHAAILHRDSHTGITIMKMDPGLDTGPILSQHSIPISPEDTTGSLTPRLAELGAALLVQTIPGYLAGDIKPEPQDESLATYAPMIKKAEAELDFDQPAESLERRVRAFNPWPGAYTTWGGNILKIHRAHTAQCTAAKPGETTIHEGLPAFGTGNGILVIDELQPAGKRAMPGEVFLHGAKDWVQD
jgi:methionyl-tRNA formyltransferase